MEIMTYPIKLDILGVASGRKAGLSRFWGLPDMPCGTDYPLYADGRGGMCPYVFLCQLDLSGLAPYDVEGRLPHEGLLSFFAQVDSYMGNFGTDHYIGGCISLPGQVRVLYFPDTDRLEPKAPPEVSAVSGGLHVPRALRIGYARAEGHCADGHMLFAPPIHRPWDTWDHPFEDWQILLQIDSFEGRDFSLQFMDCGVLCFLIHPADLEEADFSRVRAVVLSS